MNKSIMMEIETIHGNAEFSKRCNFDNSIKDDTDLIIAKTRRLLKIEKVAKEILEQCPWTSKEGRPDYACMVTADKILKLREAVESK
ncbi:hypothetical protein [Paenibacillus elgii]|uniref:hypothetical protein n=1 Tax=Paenibacillus elgii TaxID=189691 RepID=UPI00203EC4BF|nr:hypothetical protein [Paenibacillus elgii]MCM3272126.1 hypothetical protein [Paenibacillus elgii]